MRRLTISLVIILLILSSTVVHANIAEKLNNHWANEMIDRTFLAYYFPYLARDNFARFEPNGYIEDQEFTLSLASLFKDYNYIINSVGEYSSLTREGIVNKLGTRLIEIGFANDENIELPFKDVNTMSTNSIELLRVLYKNGIIVGEDNSTFNPKRNVTQVEAIIILQRVKGVLEDMNTVAFETVGIVQSYNNQEELIVTENRDKVMVTITKSFPTPGYSMDVNKIRKEKEGFRVYIDITPPKPDSIQLQVITYKTLTMEIDKALLGNPPYNFILDGFNKIPIKRNI